MCVFSVSVCVNYNSEATERNSINLCTSIKDDEEIYLMQV